MGTTPTTPIAALFCGVCFQLFHSLLHRILERFVPPFYCREVLERDNIITKRATNTVISANECESK